MTATRGSKTRRSPPDERAFLKGYDPSAYARPSVAVDVAIITVFEGALCTLLVPRHDHPFAGTWSLPGGFVAMDESLDDAAARVLATKAQLTNVFIEQLYTFGAPSRDPRLRVISVAYYALVDAASVRPACRPEGPELAKLIVPWEGETGGDVGARGATGRRLKLAFDHACVLGTAVKRMRGKVDYAPIGFQLLPPTFTLLELQKVHEVVLGRPHNKHSFRRRMLASGLLQPTGESQSHVEHRPAELYRFVKAAAV